jgi:glycosyltransferase involved in cell wall biosynthesis
VTVLSTCARNYTTWRNEYPRGEATIEGVRVLRFPAKPRNLPRFWELSQIVFSGHGTREEEERWFAENGPRAPGLIQHLADRGADYDAVLFWTYRYAPSFFGLPLVAEKAVLIPTAEEDPAIGIRLLGSFFRRPVGLFFLTEAESDLVRGVSGVARERTEIIGAGVEPAAPSVPASDQEGSDELESLGVPHDFILYLGRVDRNKGCGELFEYYARFAEQNDHAVPLVLAGDATMPIPEHPGIHYLGFVSETVRARLLSAARFLVLPSFYESLGMVVLEAWNHGRPVLVNGHCAVLRSQTLRSNGGLYFRGFEEFREAAGLLLAEPAIADRLGRQGRDFVEANYRWPTVLAKIEARLREWFPAAA